jgi:photosystem II stability/assembly factor-like uncharacterized protein
VRMREAFKRCLQGVLVVALLMGLAALVPMRSDAVVWSPLGPFGGTIHAVAIDLNNPATVYAGTRTGVWKTTDGGATWMASSTGLTDFWVRALAIDPSAPETLYAATSVKSFKSTDGGAHWDEIGAGSDTLVIAPSDPQTIYLGPLRSTDGGATWDTVLNAQVGALAVDPTDAQIVYASTPTALLKSEDGGDNWSSLDVANPWVSSILVDPSTPSRIYLADGSVSRSDDGGANWNTLTIPDGMLLYHLGAAPSAPATLYAGGRSGALPAMARSDNSGDSWSELEQIPGGVLPPVLAIDPTDAAVVYAGTFGHGVWKSADSGASFDESNEGLAAEPARDVDFDPMNPSTAYVSLGVGGGFRTGDGGATWTRIDSTLALPESDVSIQAFAVDPASHLFVSRTPALSGPGTTFPTPVLMSENGGDDWIDASGNLPDRTIIRSLYADPRNPGVLFAIGDDADSSPRTGGFYKTTVSGEFWDDYSPSPSWTAAAAFDPASNTVAIATGLGTENPTFYDGFYVSNEWGLFWDKRAYPPFPVRSLIFGPTADTIYAGSQVSSEVARSVDGGKTWSVSQVDPTNYASDIYSLALDPVDRSVIYAGTHGGGIWYSADAGVTWSAILPGVRDSDVPVIAFGPETPTTSSRLSALSAEATTSGPPAAYAGLSGRGRGGLWRVSPPPHNLHRPTLRGEAIVGQRLKCGRGSWVRANSFAFRWLRDGRPMKDADSVRYRIRLKDRGHRLSCRVTAYGDGGHRSAASRSLRGHR